MIVTCLDLEGVLVPEIWIAFADAVGIPELRRTTRDEPDYDKLMSLTEQFTGKYFLQTLENDDCFYGGWLYTR